MKKKLPLGLKILLLIFMVTGAWTAFSLFLWLPKLKGLEWNAYSTGRVFGVLIKMAIEIIINFGAGIGLLRFKKWGLGLSSAALVLGGISFATGIIRGFNEGFNGGATSNIVVMIIGFSVTGFVIFKVIKYLYKEEIKSRFI